MGRPASRRATRTLALISPLCAACALLVGCGDDPVGTPTPGSLGTEVVFDLDADLAQQASFYDQPYPTDLRLTDRGTPDLTGFPYPAVFTLAESLRQVAMEHPGFPVVPVAYFRFTGALAPRDVDAVIPAAASSPVLLLDVDEASDERGRLLPTVATVPDVDDYVPENLLAVAARAGVVLAAGRTYAFVVLRSLGDAAGAPLAVPQAMATLAHGAAPAGARGTEAQAVFAPLAPALAAAGVDPSDVAAAAVFTTGDVVKELADLSTALVAKYPITIDDLHVDPDDGAAHDRYCELVGTVTLPQLQKGMPPFDTEGLFDAPDGGLPSKQRDEVAPITVTLPKGEMPAGGFPLVLYFHGSGGTSKAIADRGTWVLETDASKCPEGKLETWDGKTGCNTKGEGPAHVLAPHGFAMANAALPVNPERLPGAAELEYLNFNNLAAGRDLFRQGAIEQRMILAALTKIAIAPAVLASCAGSTLPPGATAFRFDAKRVYAQGQSMGGQYTNMVSAIEPLVRASVPTGAGGFWSHFILHTTLIEGLAGKVGTILLGTQAPLTFLHPGLAMFQTAWEPVDPMVYMPRLSRRPLDGHPTRSVYEPVGLGDSFFSTVTYDAMALAYGHQQTGSEVWPTMQETLALAGLDGLLPYPVKANRDAGAGAYTGVIVQYEGDGVYDPHALYSQRDEVKYQYGCFLETMDRSGAATVPAPAPLGTPCPE